MTTDTGERHKVTWFDSGREPRCPPDPAYPRGKDVCFAAGPRDVPVCVIGLPYPAPRCGVLAIECLDCGLRVACTTAGRPDDPRSATLACKTRGVSAP